MKEPSLSLSRFSKKSASKVKLICSFNGAFHVRPSSNKLSYIGGESRIISVDRTVSFSKLRFKISDICPNIHAFTLKYRLPLNPDPKPDDDTPLVSIASDDDVRCLVEEYDKLESYGKHARLWLFVCTDIYDDDDKSSFDINGVVKANGVGDDSLRKKVLKQQLLAKQSCDSPLIDLDFDLEEPNDSVVKNDPFRVNVANELGNGRLRPLNPRDGNARSITVEANASVECLMGRSFQGFCNVGGNTTLMGSSVDGKQDFGDTGLMPFSNFNRENIMPWDTSGRLVNNHLGVQTCSNLRVGSGCPVKSSCVGDRVLGACQSGLRSNRVAVNDARYQRIYPYCVRSHKRNLVEVGNYRGVRLDGKIPVGKCYLGIRPNTNISKQGRSMGLYNANLSSPWAGFTKLASEGVASVMGCFNKGMSTFDVQYGEKFREHGGPAISQYWNSNLVESHLACHGTCNFVGDQFFLSHNAINSASTLVRLMNTKDDMLTGSNFERHEVQCQALCENFHGMPITCKPFQPDLENEKLLIDSEENSNISGLSNNMNYINGTVSGCNMNNGTKNLQGGVASSMDLLYNLSLSSSKEIEPPQISSLQNAATRRIDEHKEELQQDPLKEKVDIRKTCECSKVIGEISSGSADFTNSAVAELQTIKTSDLEYIKELGSGTFGTVFYGKWKGSDVAIKRIKPSCFAEGLEEDRLVADFWREAHLLGQLHHPNVVAFYGVVTDGPVTNLATVTEYMVNGSLKQVLRRKDRIIDRRKRMIIAMDAAFGIEYLHEKNIVHFDLKSHNFLVNMRDPQRPVCKIGDLGLSKIKQKTLISGGVRGTIPWMAPELFNSKDSLVTEKVDVYSFGIVMWELLTGEEPYAELHSKEIIAGIIKGSLRPEIPSWCEPTWRSLMERCWSSNPNSRPAFSEIAKELRAMAAAMNIK